MTHHRRILQMLVTVAVLVFFNLNALLFAMDGDTSRVLLSDLTSVYVQIKLNDESEEKGLDADQLRRDTEKQLKNAGLKILSETEYEKFKIVKNYPLARLDIIVTMNAFQVDETDVNINQIAVQARQKVFLWRKPKYSIFATTWEKRTINLTTNTEAVVKEIGDIVGQFIRSASS